MASDDSRKTFDRSALPLAALVGGVVLIGLSLVWPSVSNGRSQWTDAKAEEYQAASAKLHGLSHSHGDDDHAGHDHAHDGHEDHAERIRDAQARFDALRGELESARQGPSRLASAMRVLGIVLTAIGAVASYRMQLRGIA